MEGDDDIVLPMCNSSSLLLEAALLWHQIALRLLRCTKFALQKSPQFERQMYETYRREAMAAEKHDVGPMLLGTDRYGGGKVVGNYFTALAFNEYSLRNTPANLGMWSHSLMIGTS